MIFGPHCTILPITKIILQNSDLQDSNFLNIKLTLYFRKLHNWAVVLKSCSFELKFNLKLIKISFFLYFDVLLKKKKKKKISGKKLFANPVVLAYITLLTVILLISSNVQKPRRNETRASNPICTTLWTQVVYRTWRNGLDPIPTIKPSALLGSRVLHIVATGITAACIRSRGDVVSTSSDTSWTVSGRYVYETVLLRVFVHTTYLLAGQRRGFLSGHASWFIWNDRFGMSLTRQAGGFGV